MPAREQGGDGERLARPRGVIHGRDCGQFIQFDVDEVAEELSIDTALSYLVIEHDNRVSNDHDAFNVTSLNEGHFSRRKLQFSFTVERLCRAIHA